jgi:hypothetical protein
MNQNLGYLKDFRNAAQKRINAGRIRTRNIAKNAFDNSDHTTEKISYFKGHERGRVKEIECFEGLELLGIMEF